MNDLPGVVAGVRHEIAARRPGSDHDIRAVIAELDELGAGFQNFPLMGVNQHVPDGKDGMHQAAGAGNQYLQRPDVAHVGG